MIFIIKLFSLILLISGVILLIGSLVNLNVLMIVMSLVLIYLGYKIFKSAKSDIRTHEPEDIIKETKIETRAENKTENKIEAKEDVKSEIKEETIIAKDINKETEEVEEERIDKIIIKEDASKEKEEELITNFKEATSDISIQNLSEYVDKINHKEKDILWYVSIIKFLIWIDNKKITKDLPKYMISNYGINNFDKIKEDLIEKGLIEMNEDRFIITKLGYNFLDNNNKIVKKVSVSHFYPKNSHNFVLLDSVIKKIPRIIFFNVVGVEYKNKNGKSRKNIIKKFIKQELENGSISAYGGITNKDIKEMYKDIEIFEIPKEHIWESGIIFEKEPENKYDENAVKVILEDFGCIGYVPKTHNVDLLEHYDEIDSVSFAIFGGRYKKYDGEFIERKEKDYEVKIDIRLI